MAEWRKVIPEGSDRMQSRVLVWCVMPVLILACIFLLTIASGAGLEVRALLVKAACISGAFALSVWRLKAGTGPAAACGAVICLVITVAGGLDARGSVLHTGLLPLATLFVLTFVSTRAGRRRKAAAGLAESRRGRNAAQVVANLGVAALVGAAALLREAQVLWSLLMFAALCESTADTVSSEIGQAFGGPPILLTSFRRVEPGTDGAVTLLGTGAGVLAACLVAAVGTWAMGMSARYAAFALAGGVAGLLFDSVLGATAETRGWLGNDLVNFSSTLFAAGVALGLGMAC